MDDHKAKLPEWAEKIVPVDMNGAGMLLGVSRRFLVDVLRDHPHYELRGAKKVFYPEHITRLREALSSPASIKPRVGAYRTPSLPISADDVFERAMALASKRSGSGRK